jgi:hypothetical protein
VKATGTHSALTNSALHQESWFLAHAFRLAACLGLRGVVSHSDPQPRHRPDGVLVRPGHVGIICQASNAVYAGRTGARTAALLPDGTMLSGRAAQKIRAQERGHSYAEQQLVRLGARPMRAGENPAAWLARALDDARARPVRHRGHHRYLFPIGPARTAVSIALPARAYPKAADPEPFPWPLASSLPSQAA